MKILKNKAFTLAEVLITLGIIGVVAAMTIPTLIANYQKKQTALGVKKAYTELNQIVRMATADYGDPSGWDYYGEDELQQWVETYILPYTKATGAQLCSNFKPCQNINLFRPLHSSRVSHMNGNYVISKLGSPVGYAFTRYGGTYGKETRVRVYINNPQKPMIGRDIFTFVFSTGEDSPTFKPYGIGKLGSPYAGIQNAKREELLGTRLGGCNQKASGSGYWGPGDACAAVIMMDNWQISKDYPW